MQANSVSIKVLIGSFITAVTFVSGISTSMANTSISEAEWITWPEFCQAGYLASEWSAGSTFKSKMSDSKVRSIRDNHNVSVGIPGVHHFCVGMVYINRAKVANSAQKRGELLRNSINEIEYSFSRMNPVAPRFSLVTAYYGKALYLSGKRQLAFDMWTRGITAKPESRESYLMMAEALLKERKPKEALDILLRYDSSKTADAADAEAFLAQTYIELGMLDKAKKHADAAYNLGYPFPGLRNKLERLGK